MKVLKFCFFFSIVAIFPLVCSQELSLQFDCQEFAFPGNRYQTQKAYGENISAAANYTEGVHTYYHGTIKNEGNVLRFRLVPKEGYDYMSTKQIDDLGIKSRTQYNDWELSLVERGIQQK